MLKYLFTLALTSFAFQAHAVTVPTQFSAHVHGDCVADEDSIPSTTGHPSQRSAEEALAKKVEKEVRNFYIFGCKIQGVIAFEKFTTQNEDGSLFCPGTSATATYRCSFSW